jgi:hypothetical protein
MSLVTDPTLSPQQADDAYATLLTAHQGLSPQDSAALNARLILILMNQIGDAATVRQAITAAKEAGTSRADA